MSCWIVGPATTPGMDVKFVLFPRKEVDQHREVVQACAQIAYEHEQRVRLQALEERLGQLRAERFAKECLNDF